MFSKNLQFYRLRASMTKKELAERCKLTPMAISNYESGKRMPDMEILKNLANVLNVKVSDFLAVRNNKLVFEHGEFRKTSNFSISDQEYVKESVEEYFSRFFTIVEILGGEVLPNAPKCHSLILESNIEQNAKAMRQHLKVAEEGPLSNLVAILENKGILSFFCNISSNKFSGMNGFVNKRPYIIINSNMSPERVRSTIAHELAHLLFIWPKNMPDKEIENVANAIAGAFLFPKTDMIREIGIRRNKVTNDMTLVCKEYGISMFLLVKRAQLEKIISNEVAINFYILASSNGWRTNEPSRIEIEKPLLFNQLVYRAINEGEISVQRGAELLCTSYSDVVSNCLFKEV